MIWSYRFVRAIREPSNVQDGWWVVYCSAQKKGDGILYSAEDLAGRVKKVGNRWLTYFQESEDELTDVICESRAQAADEIVRVALGYYNVPSHGAAIVHHNHVEALL